MDRYVVQEKIARGGMGIVFRGEDERLHRPVCVKVFASLDPSRPEYATVLEHFVQEAFTLSRLRHPNTLRIYDFGYLDEKEKAKPFFVTEYADAGTLTELVEEQGGLVPLEVIRILDPVVGALREAHDAGVVHRDIKPSNILFTLAGGGLIPKLADFSIAKATADFPNRAHDTNVRVPLYSLSWAAPEQLTGGYIGPAADVFALGLTTVFMLTSMLVYAGDEIMQLYALRSRGGEYVDEAISSLALPESIEEVMQKACRHDPQERFPSVESFFEALRTAVELDNTKIRRPEIPIVAAQPGAGAVDSPPLSGPRPGEDSTPTQELEQHHPHAIEGNTEEVPATGPSETSGLSSRPYEHGPRPVSPSEPSGLPTMATKPRLELSDLSVPEVLVGSRRLRPMQLRDGLLSLPGASTQEPPRLRMTPVEVDGPTLHIKGLNCFLRREGGRPSSGLDVRTTSVIELVTMSFEVAARIRVRLATRESGRYVFELDEAVLLVPASLARWAVVVEVGAGRDAQLLYQS